jgi:Haem-binding domain
VIKIFLCFAGTFALALPFVHPFGNVKEQSSSAPLIGVHPIIERACQSCHSERTQWPAYSYLPLVSWAIEKDVAEGREHLNFSHWDRYSADDKRDLLARIGTMVRNRQMPLPRFVLLHPEARLSEEEIQAIYDWTREQRKILRSSIKSRE